MSVSDRRAREKELLRKLILETAAEIVSKKGHEELTIRDLAKRIEYSPRTIYLYFEDKQALLNAIIEHGFAFTVGRMKERVKQNPGSEILLREMITGHLHMAFGNPNFYRAVVSMTNHRDFSPGPFQSEVNSMVSMMLQDYLGKDEDVDFYRSYLMNSLRAYTLTQLQKKHKPADIGSLASRFFNLITLGLKGVSHGE